MQQDEDCNEDCADCTNFGETYVETNRRRFSRSSLESQTYLPSIHQLALTNKFFRQLSLPYIYDSVDFEALPNAVLRQYIDIIVPKYGHFVKEVRPPALVIAENLDQFLQFGSVQLWIRISCSENAEFFEIDDQDADDENRFEQEKRFSLTLEMLKSLPNLTIIDIDYTYLHNTPPTGLFNEIASRGAKLQGLHLGADVMEVRLTSSQVSTMLQSLPQLTHLELSGLDRQSSDGPILKDVIAGMATLKCLDLADCHCVNDDWAGADWQCTLEALELDE